MKKKWDTDYKWELNKTEEAFDKRLKENDFNIVGIAMYQSKTVWLIEKDGVKFEYAILKEANKIESAWKSFVYYYETSKAYNKLRAFAMNKN